MKKLILFVMIGLTLLGLAACSQAQTTIPSQSSAKEYDYMSSDALLQDLDIDTDVIGKTVKFTITDTVIDENDFLTNPDYVGQILAGSRLDFISKHYVNASSPETMVVRIKDYKKVNGIYFISYTIVKQPIMDSGY